ncbi:MAG: hypothetical protein QI223_08815, partial [Candidatus Korarchaeota archaeon]|nr:hypothetical protein [Candidatus Korarchaeota archaeon]
GVGSEAAPAVLAYSAGELARRAGRRLTLARVEERPQLWGRFLAMEAAGELLARDAEVEELADRLESEDMVLLEGRPGIGKTVLALQLARRLYPEVKTFYVSCLRRETALRAAEEASMLREGLLILDDAHMVAARPRWGEEGPLEEILGWLRNSGARVLVVARPFEETPGPLVGTSRLGGLVERAVRPTVREVLDFIIEREAGRRGWDLTDGDRVALRSACGYEPLNLRYLLRSWPGPPEVPKEGHALRAVRDLLNRESVSELGKVLLAAVAALYRAEVPAPEWLLFRVGEKAGYGRRDVEEALDRLVERGLLIRGEGGGYLMTHSAASRKFTAVLDEMVGEWSS